MDTNDDAKTRSRRKHDSELKRQVLAECSAARASVAKVAMAHGLNANLVHKWRREAQRPAQAAAAFVPVAVAPTAVISEPPQHIELELHRGTVTVRVRWPIAVTASCAAWLREILR